jgi:hypothetical protein
MWFRPSCILLDEGDEFVEEDAENNDKVNSDAQ